MDVEKAVIKSNNIKYGPIPAFNDEVEQHVKIHRDGRIQITRYVFGSGVRKHGYVKAAKNAYQIPADKAAELLDLIGEYFSEHDEDEQWLVKDAGEFRISITMEDGTRIRRFGALVCDFRIGDDNLNSIIRKTLGVGDLFLFKLPVPAEEGKPVTGKEVPAEEHSYPEDLTDRQVYDTSIGPVCMSKREYQDYQDQLAIRQMNQENNDSDNGNGSHGNKGKDNG